MQWTFWGLGPFKLLARRAVPSYVEVFANSVRRLDVDLVALVSVVTSSNSRAFMTLVSLGDVVLGED
jgi:hypothetical protein